MVRLECSARTDVGRVRELNEDSLLVRDGLFVVADGMGGHAGGEVASALAAAEFGALRSSDDRGGLALADLVGAVERSHRAITEAADRGRPGMGTTVVALALHDDEHAPTWSAVNVGDSRLYRLRAHQLDQVSVDHSVIQELLDAGQVSPEEAGTHPQRHVLTRALGTLDGGRPDCWSFPVVQDDVFLLCSDGLTGEVPEPRIRELLDSPASAEEIARALVDEALRAGGHDNVTVVVTRVLEAPITAADIDAAAASWQADTEPRPRVVPEGTAGLIDAVPAHLRGDAG